MAAIASFPLGLTYFLIPTAVFDCSQLQRVEFAKGFPLNFFEKVEIAAVGDPKVAFFIGSDNFWSRASSIVVAREIASDK